jgi:hypothetical protein
MHIARLIMAALGAALLLGACMTVVREPAPPPSPAPRVVVREIPAPVAEARPAPPASGWHWRPGHWAWHDTGWRWVPGEWLPNPVPPMPPVIVEQVPAAPSPAHAWVRGHWTWSNGWVWVQGHWVRV